MIDPELGLALVFNGAIYNYRELRRDLLNKGYRFFSDGDTEVILKAYAEWGERCVERFRGMFAFGLYDRAARSLFLASIAYLPTLFLLMLLDPTRLPGT